MHVAAKEYEDTCFDFYPNENLSGNLYILSRSNSELTSCLFNGWWNFMGWKGVSDRAGIVVLLG
jgi:hypothetical protein